MKNINLFIIYIYSVPTILALGIIFYNGHLIGDFRSYEFELSFVDLILVFFEYLTPLFFIYLLLYLSRNVVLFKPKSNLFINFSLYSLLIVFVITLFFGAVKVGVPSVSGISGILTSLVYKINPYLLVLILSFSKINLSKFVFCLSVCLFYSFEQHSLQGYLIVFFALMIYYLNSRKISTYKIYFLLLAPLLMSGPLLELLKYIYITRNEMRGVTANFSTDEIIYLAVGRISSLSSYLYVKSKEYEFSSISDFFSFGIFISRFLGTSIFSVFSPSDLFNKEVLGVADYSIFLGVNGFLYFLYESSIPLLIVNVIVVLFVLIFIYFLIPFFESKKRIAMFFMIIYMFYLSSDIWELSILFQNLIVINVLYFCYEIIYNLFSSKLNRKKFI